MTDAIARAVFGLMFESSTEALFIADRTTGRVVSANVRVAELALHHEPGFRELCRTPGAHEERDVALRLNESRAEISAERAGTYDQNSHA